MDTAIVAIPSVDDYVWNISSEKIPHLTLLFLGDQSNNPKLSLIRDFLEHVADTSMYRFGLSVDRRDVLGDKNADVLFFDGHGVREVERLRNSLLQNDAISAAYNSVEQFSSWVPHLTLGYPESPAKPDPREYPGFHWVNFDKIALWTGDFEGPEFRLKEMRDLMMSGTVDLGQSISDSIFHATGEDDYNLEEEYGWLVELVDQYVDDNPELFHYGVKGMKWGVRKDDSSGGNGLHGLGPDTITRTTKTGDTITLTKKPPSLINKGLAKLSSNYRESYNKGAFFEIHDKDGKKVGEANLWKKSEDELYLNWIGIKSSARGNGYASAVLKAAEEFGSKSGLKRMTLEVPGNAPDARHIYEKLGFRVTKEDIDPNDPVWGGLTEMEYTFSNSAKHGDAGSRGASAIAELFHYGVKGMKWGVRKDDSPTSVTVAQKRPGGKLTATGGKNQPASEDAKKAAASYQKAKASTLDSLSNEELQSLVRRMNLEQQFTNLSAGRQSAGSKFIKKLFYDAGKRQITSAFNDQADAYGKQIRDKLND